jgi:hypothetical protein
MGSRKRSVTKEDPQKSSSKGKARRFRTNFDQERCEKGGNKESSQESRLRKG